MVATRSPRTVKRLRAHARQVHGRSPLAGTDLHPIVVHPRGGRAPVHEVLDSSALKAKVAKIVVQDGGRGWALDEGLGFSVPAREGV